MRYSTSIVPLWLKTVARVRLVNFAQILSDTNFDISALNDAYLQLEVTVKPRATSVLESQIFTLFRPAARRFHIKLP